MKRMRFNLKNGFIAGVLLTAMSLPAGSLWAQDEMVADGVRMDEAMFLRTYREPGVQLAPGVRASQMRLPDTVAPPRPRGDTTSGGRAGVPAVMEIGYTGAVPDGLFESAPWYRLEDGGRVKRIELYSQDATALRVIMTDLGDLELRVYDPVSKVAWGPYRTPRLNEDGTWWSTIIFGDTIGLEFHLPAGSAFPPKVMPKIVGIFYAYADFNASDFDPQGAACLADVMCFAAWRGTIEDHAIGMLIGTTGCTGALINRNIGDFSPIMMTARHCITTQAEANGVVVIWFNQNQTCNGNNAPNINTLPRNDGALLLKTDFASEWTLMGLYDPPGSGSYIGWDASYWGNGGSSTCISHPGLRPKRISFGSKTADSGCLGASSFYNQWTTGRIEPGSSGSPVYDVNRRARGTASCASDTDGDGVAGPCAPDGWYGRLDVGWTDLQWYLNNPANPSYANWAVGGDAGNDGNSERGTAGNPFNTAYEATFCVPTNGTVRIVPGNYNERFRLWRPMTIIANSAGTVRIGAP